jgi:hypothetical protein
MILFFYQLQGTGVAPSHTGWSRRNAAKIALEGKTGLRFNEQRLFRARGSANQTHVIGLITYNQLIL